MMNKSAGITLLELIVAMTIAGIVMTLGFTVYGGVLRGFSCQSRAAEELADVIILQKRIDRACNGFTTIGRWTDREITGIDATTDSTRTIRFSGTSLLEGNDTIASHLSRFVFSLTENERETNDRKAVLLWEGTLEGRGGWIGGAAVVGNE